MLFTSAFVPAPCDAGVVDWREADWLCWQCVEDLMQGGGGLSVAPVGSGLKEGCCGSGLGVGFLIPVLAQSIPIWTLWPQLGPSSMLSFLESTSSHGQDWLCLF